jgi:tetratricopeptide (TPR) repeat protein
LQLCLLSASTITPPLQADDFQSGLEAYHESQYTEATAAFERSLESSDSAATHHNLALSLYQQGQITAAIWQLERALRLEPLNEAYIFKLGLLRHKLGLYESPTTWWQSAANMLTKSAWIWIASSGFWMVSAVLALPRIGGFQRPIFLKLSSVIAAVCLLLAVTALTIQITQQPSGIVISKEAVDLHHAPASAAPEAGVARPGERARIIDQHKDFLKVETEAAITGWIQVDAFREL